MAAVGCVLAVGMTSACATPPEQGEAEAAARAFVADVRTHPARACGRLAPATRTALEDRAEAPCAQALPDEDLPTTTGSVSVEVAGHSALARTDADRIYLARFADGWRVTAAGCTARDGDLPDDCDLQGE